jgi:CTP:molybdopterin cytidylyltransferase MocA
VLGDVVTVINDKWEEGMASSIRLGVRALGFAARDAEGVLLMTCDQPAVTAKHLRRLMTRAEVKASRYAGRNGVPAFFPKKYFDRLMELEGDAGARELLADARYEELENGELDVDTVEDLKRARELFG